MSDNLAHALSGAGGGIISMIVTYPLVSISARLQVQDDDSEENYKNTMDAFVKIFKQEGFKGYYSGFTSGVFGITVTNGVYYYCYEALKTMLTHKRNQPLTTVQSMIASTVAGTAVVVVTHPIWTVNTRMSVQRRVLSAKSKRPSTMQIFLYILNREGLVGLYAGIKAALILVLNPIIQYTLYEKIKSKFNTKLNGLDYFLLGAVSKLISTMIMYPYILIKSRLQLNNNNKSTMENIKEVIRNEGIRGLYKGLNSKLIQSILTSAFLFYAKEVLFNWSVWILRVKNTSQPS